MFLFHIYGLTSIHWDLALGSRVTTPSFDALQGFRPVLGIGPSSHCEDVR